MATGPATRCHFHIPAGGEAAITTDLDEFLAATVGGLLVGYARVPPTSKTSPPSEALAGLGVAPERIYVDPGLTGTTRARPGLREALAACHDGDTSS